MLQVTFEENFSFICQNKAILGSILLPTSRSSYRNADEMFNVSVNCILVSAKIENVFLDSSISDTPPRKIKSTGIGVPSGSNRISYKSSVSVAYVSFFA